MTMKLEMIFKLLIGIRHDEETNLYVSYSPALDMYSQGRTHGEAEHALTSGVKLFLKTHYTLGTLESTLSLCGFKAINGGTEKAYTEDEFIKLREYEEKKNLEVPLTLERQLVTAG